jgi:cation-transporting P-type ATPase I
MNTKAEPVDEALRKSARTLQITRQYNCSGWKQVSELSFEAARGYHVVLGQTEDGFVFCIKGAPEVILDRCSHWNHNGEMVPCDDDVLDVLAREANRLAREGLRILAVADGRVDSQEQFEPENIQNLVFKGFLAFSDPVRPSAAQALESIRKAGVESVMITGDHPGTAEAIGEELHILDGKTILSGVELSTMSDEELDARIQRISIFARVTPAQKVRIVRAFQRAGKVVAMIGDGANDAPAIRLADVGIAIGERSTSAARNAADIVVTDERIETLVDAIVEGRATWASVRDAVSILVGGNLGEILFTLGAGLVDGRPPLTARQLLLVNLLTDIAPAMAIALRPPSQTTLEALANEGPEASLGNPLNRDIAARAVITAAGAAGAWTIGRFTGSSARARTIALAALVGTQLGQTLTSGGANTPVLVTSLGSAALMVALIQTPFVSQFFGCRPLGPIGWATALGSSAAATATGVLLPAYLQEIAERVQSRVQRVFAQEAEVAPIIVEVQPPTSLVGVEAES